MEIHRWQRLNQKYLPFECLLWLQDECCQQVLNLIRSDYHWQQHMFIPHWEDQVFGVLSPLHTFHFVISISCLCLTFESYCLASIGIRLLMALCLASCSFADVSDPNMGLCWKDACSFCPEAKNTSKQGVMSASKTMIAPFSSPEVIYGTWCIGCKYYK